MDFDRNPVIKQNLSVKSVIIFLGMPTTQGDYKVVKSKKRARTYTPYSQSKYAADEKHRRRRRNKIPRQPLPSSYVCQLVYSDAVTLTPTTDVNSNTKIDFHVFRANNIYDPNYSGGTHQPRGRDDLAAHYQKYCVLSSYIEARPILNTESHVKGYTGVHLSKKVTDIAHPMQMALRTINVRDILEGPFKYNKVLRITRDNAIGAGPNTISSKCAFNGTRAFGKGWTKDTDFQMDMEEFEPTNANPPDQKKNYYFYLWAINEPTSGTHSQATHFRVTIKYIVKFFDRKAFSVS